VSQVTLAVFLLGSGFQSGIEYEGSFLWGSLCNGLARYLTD
jgi:hypothetical protein